jgi:hypothetical protein
VQQQLQHRRQQQKHRRSKLPQQRHRQQQAWREHGRRSSSTTCSSSSNNSNNNNNNNNNSSSSSSRKQVRQCLCQVTSLLHLWTHSSRQAAVSRMHLGSQLLQQPQPQLLPRLLQQQRQQQQPPKQKQQWRVTVPHSRCILPETLSSPAPQQAAEPLQKLQRRQHWRLRRLRRQQWRRQQQQRLQRRRITPRLHQDCMAALGQQAPAGCSRQATGMLHKG